MKLCAVLILLCLLTGRAPCKTVRRGAMKATIRRLQEEIQNTVDILNTRGLLPNETCPSMNITEIMGAEQEPLTMRHVSSIVCHLTNMTGMALSVADNLWAITQMSSDIETALGVNSTQCNLPTIEGNMEKYQYVKCFLESLKPRLNKVLP